ncbi:MAG: hypothetical protein ACD_33C00005G0009 [uncultured bacterium]|nr:MAG: hypothetical protein ACD_33C00005G0009 [uncultured bacterium]
MDYRILLTKILTLLYRSRILNNVEHDDLIRTLLNTIKTDTPELNFSGHNTIKQLKDFCLELLEDKEEVAKEVIVQRLSIVLENDDKLYKITKEAIEVEYDDSTSKRIITSLVKLLNNYYKESLAIDLINRINYEVKFNRNKITNFSDYLKNAITQLEPLANSISTIKDPGMISEVDFENPDNLNLIFDEVKSINNNTGIYTTGWQGLNTMLQGGIRRGELITVGALQHKYKTGFTLSLFMQIARLNKPIVLPNSQDKKPLMLRISFEDSLTNNLQFMYQYLKQHDDPNFDIKMLDTLNTSDMSSYCVGKLTSTGFHIKMMRVDPSQWTYLNIVNKIIELEAQGFEVHILMLDYISLLPTTGCSTGPMGFDKKDLLRRVRNFCSARNIAVITPLQLSSEAKMLLRNGVPEQQLVNDVAEKGYYDGTKSIDQDIDCELFIHLFNYKKRKYLAIRRGKHRLPTVIDDSDKYMLLRFPGLNIPILEDIDKPISSFKTLPREAEDSNKDSMLNEILN